MAVDAARLSKSGARGKDLDVLIREQIQIIDDRLLRADRTWGRNVVAYDLPVTLALPGLDKKDAQRIVYSSVLRSLDGRGFETCIDLGDDRTTVYIAWTTELGKEEVDAMNDLIVSKRVDAAGAAAFVEGRHTADGRRKKAPRPDAAKP